MSQNTVSLKLTRQEVDSLKSILTKIGWVEEEVSNEYVALRMKNERGSVCTLYTSMKVVFQGKEDFESIVEELQGNQEEREIIPHIGVDEVGKGDYFGPLVVAACFADEDFKKKIEKLGVGDSKKISDGRIRSIYSQIKDYPYYYVSIVSPKEYNLQIKELGNASVLLAKQHSKVIEMGLSDLMKRNIKCERVVVDQFSLKENRVLDELGPLGKKVEFVQYHKGEADIAVACASVLARAIFLEKLDEMNNEYYFTFPKGASNVISSAREFVRKNGVEELESVAKVSFKTTKKVIQDSF